MPHREQLNNTWLNSTENTIAEIVSAYFTDKFYNDIYASAVESVKSGKATSISDSYKSILISLNGAMKIKETYERYVTKFTQGLFVYTSSTLKNPGLSFPDFIDKIVGIFIPSAYFTALSESQKSAALSNVISSTIKLFIKEIINNSDMKNKIVDDHKNTANVRAMQDLGLVILADVKETLYTKFVAEPKIGKSSGKISQQHQQQTEIIKLREKLEKSKQRIKELEQQMEQQNEHWEKTIHGLLKQMEAKIAAQVISQMSKKSTPDVQSMLMSTTPAAPVSVPTSTPAPADSEDENDESEDEKESEELTLEQIVQKNINRKKATSPSQE
jgi:hypothetical protein